MDISTILLSVYVFFVAVFFTGIQDSIFMVRVAEYLRPMMQQSTTGVFAGALLYVIATFCFAAVRPAWFICLVFAGMVWPGPGSSERNRP